MTSTPNSQPRTAEDTELAVYEALMDSGLEPYGENGVRSEARFDVTDLGLTMLRAAIHGVSS